MATTSAQVQQLYVAYLGRAADKGGLDYWLGQLNATPAKITLDQIRANFVNEQPEYKAAYEGLSRVDTVTKIYNNLFGRAPDAGGLAYWTTGGGSTVAIDQLLTAFINGASAADAKTVANKVLVSEVYTSTADTNYKAADAKAIIVGVSDSNLSVSNAIAKLSDGSLSGIAVPAAALDLKASATADKAVTDFETTKAAELLALAKQIETLSKKDAQLTDTSVTSDENTPYVGVGGVGGVSGEVKSDLAQARAGLASKTTATLSNEASTAAALLLTKADALRLADNASVDKMTAYDVASKALIANVATEPDVKTVAINSLAAYGSVASNQTAFNKALADVGLTPTGTTLADAVTDAAALYNKLVTTATSNQISNVTTDLSGAGTAFTNFASAAAKDKAAAKALDDFNTAKGALTGTAAVEWKTAYGTDATAKLKVAASTSLDALDNAYAAIDNAHTALTAAQTTAQDKLTAIGSVTKLATELADTYTFTDNAAKAEVFYFPAKKASGSDGAVTLEAGKDSLYIGEGYTLKASATLSAKGIVGADNNALEVFFIKDGGVVKAVVETTVAGSLSVTGSTLPTAADNVSVITLTGVTDVSQVTFANGVISHV